MPAPVSETDRRTYSPGSPPTSLATSLSSSTTLLVSITSLPPAGMASRELMARLSTAFSTSLGSAWTDHRRGASSVPSAIASPSVRRSSSAMASTCSLRSRTTGSRRRRRANVSRRLVSRAPISAALLARASRSRCSASFELHLEQLVVAGDDGQQVVEVVRDAAGQLADRLHALRLAQGLVLHDLLADVANELDEADELAVLDRAGPRQPSRRGRPRPTCGGSAR